MGPGLQGIKALTEIEVFIETFFKNSGFNYIPVVDNPYISL